MPALRITYDKWIYETLYYEYNKFFNTMYDITEIQIINNGSTIRYTKFAEEVAKATKYQSIPKYLYDLPKKGKAYNKFMHGLIKHLEHNDDAKQIMLFYEL